MSGKRHIFLLIFLCLAFVLNAQEARKHDISADFMAMGLVGYNTTYQWYGGTDLKGVMHIDNTDFTINIEALTEKTFSLGLTGSQAFKVCDRGYVFVDGTIHTRVFPQYDVYEVVYAGSVGYKMRHFSVQMGMFSRTIDMISRSWHSLDSPVTEPFNLLYKFKYSIMGFDNKWDIDLTFANYNDYEYERMWEPMFSMGGRWDFKDRWSAVAEGMLQPAGQFHGTIKFCEATLRAGIIFKLR